MVFRNPIKFTHMPLSLIPEILYSVNMILLVGKQLTVVNMNRPRFARHLSVIQSD